MQASRRDDDDDDDDTPFDLCQADFDQLPTSAQRRYEKVNQPKRAINLRQGDLSSAGRGPHRWRSNDACLQHIWPEVETQQPEVETQQPEEQSRRTRGSKRTAKSSKSQRCAMHCGAVARMCG